MVLLIIVAVLLFILYQDLRYRAVYWLAFPALLLLMLLYSASSQTLVEVLKSTGLNVLFLLFQLFLLCSYFSVKAGKWTNITRSHLGWGDILFLVCIAFYLSPLNYMFFYVLSLVIVLIGVCVVLIIRPNRQFTIPLAGVQSVLFAFLLLTDVGIESITLLNDHWILNHIGI